MSPAVPDHGRTARCLRRKRIQSTLATVFHPSHYTHRRFTTVLTASECAWKGSCVWQGWQMHVSHAFTSHPVRPHLVVCTDCSTEDQECVRGGRANAHACAGAKQQRPNVERA